MLSKVLSGRDGAGAQPMVYPVLPPDSPGFRRRAEDNPPEPESGDAAALRQSLQQLQLTAAAERRDAAEAGRRQGDREAREELAPIMERLNASIAGIVAMRPDLRRRAEQDVVHLALLIARRVIHRQLSVDENALTAIAHMAFERLAQSESYTVTVHPRFASSIASALPVNQAARVKIVPDPDCAQGTLIIHSAEGVIDASVDVQLEEINRGLTDRLEGSS